MSARAKLAPIVAAALVALLSWPARADPPEPVREVGYGQIRYAGHGPEWWHWRYVRARRAARARWRPTVGYALRLASAAYGVPYWDLRAVAWCESRLDPWAANGRYKGLMQLGWSPFGFSPFDPVASALSTAAVVKREGWRQWECRP